MKNKATKSKAKLSVLTGLILLVIAGGSFVAFRYFRHKTASKDSSPKPTETINYSPASPVEKKESEDNKDRIVDEQNQAQNTPSSAAGTKKSVTPTIVSADSHNVSAYVTGIFEEGGTCTATFTKDSTKNSQTSSGFQNVSYTQCAPISLADGLLSSGTWSLVVSYSSSTAEGASASKQVVVP